VPTSKSKNKNKSACQRATQREVQHITHENKTFFSCWHASKQNYIFFPVGTHPNKLFILIVSVVGTHPNKLFILIVSVVGTHQNKLIILFLSAHIQANYYIIIIVPVWK
jgi:hypothetical protein